MRHALSTTPCLRALLRAGVHRNLKVMIPMVADANVSMHEAKVFGVQVMAGFVREIEPNPSVPYAPWPIRGLVPQTPRSAQPEGQVS